MKNSAVVGSGLGFAVVLCFALIFGPPTINAAPAEESSPFPIPFADKAEQIQSGVSKILDGVRGTDLQQVLRGSFDFSNDHTKRIADGVISAVFRDRNTNNAAAAAVASTSSLADTAAKQVDKVA